MEDKTKVHNSFALNRVRSWRYGQNDKYDAWKWYAAGINETLPDKTTAESPEDWISDTEYWEAVDQFQDAWHELKREEE